MASLPEFQVAELSPPRRGAVLAIEVDSTARAYDLSSLAIGGDTPEAAKSGAKSVVLWLQAETNDVFFVFQPDGTTVMSDTGKVSAGGAVAYAASYCALLKSGTTMRVRINRPVDKFIVVKAASTSGVLRLWAASSESP